MLRLEKTYLVAFENFLQSPFPVADGRIVEKKVKQQRLLEAMIWGAVHDGGGEVVLTLTAQKLSCKVKANGTRSRAAQATVLNTEADTAIP